MIDGACPQVVQHRPHWYCEGESGALIPIYDVLDDRLCVRRWRHHTHCTLRHRWKLWRKYDVLVSTVFLCLDHSFDGGPPVLYETMLFGTPDGVPEFQVRYTTRALAERGHNIIVGLVKRRAWRELDALPYKDFPDAGTSGA